MHFAELTEMGHHYHAEEGTPGVRRAALDSFATKLREARINLQAAKAGTGHKVGTGTVLQKAAFFQGGAGGAQRAAAEQDVKKYERDVAAWEAKLTRQGAVLRPDGTIDWGLTSRQVIYDHTALAQGLTRLHMHGGLLYSDAAHTQKFDTQGMVTAFGGKGWAIYVMSETGNIHASAHSVGHRHHSSLLAGADVAGAGEMRVLQGKLVHISNKSGHYAPAAAHFLQVLHVMQKRGASLYGAKVSFKTATGQEDYPSVDAFLAGLRRQGIESDYEYAKMIAYLERIPYAQFQPMAAANGWRWVDPGEIAAGRRGVVRIVDGSAVTPKEVRRWLKGRGYTLGGAVGPLNVAPKVQQGWGR